VPLIYDLLIIGAGPAGLACGIEAKRAGLSYLIIDKGGIVNSIQQFQRDMYFFSTPELLEIGGVPFVVPGTRPTSRDCVNYYRAVTQLHDLNCRFYEKALSAERADNAFRLRTDRRGEYLARAIVVATGYYDTPSPLNVPGEHLSHVTHFYRDPLPYFRQHVVIVGGKNSAVEAALDLWRHGAIVTVIHRGSTMSPSVKYWIMPDFQNRVNDGAITLHLESTVREFRRGETVIHRQGVGEIQIPTDFVFILIGYRPDVEFLASLGIGIDTETLAPVHDPETMETNVRNLFVAGGLVGGKFNNKIFIENGRAHGKKIVSALVGGTG